MMKIAVSASGPDLEAQVEPHFGRAPYFLIVDMDTMEFEAVPNQTGRQAPQGAGIQAAALVARQRPAAILTGHCGPRAFQTLQTAGIQVILGMEGSVREAVRNYGAGKFRPAQSPNTTSHWR